MKFFKIFDLPIFLSILLIGIMGLVMIWSLEPSLFFQQFIFFTLGLFVFFLFVRIDFRIFENLSWLLYFVSLLFLISTFFWGRITRGSIRWIQIGSFTIQPSEIVKPFLVLFFASFLAKEKLSLVRILIAIFFLLPPLIFVFKQPDLGSTLIILFSFMGILFSSSLSLSYFLIGFLGLGIISPIVWFFLKSYQKARILSFINPYSDPQGMGYNIIQSVITVGSGMFFGRGLGKGTQSHLAFLPERHTDFIFASLSEELGFLGAAFALFCYLFILFRIIKIIQDSPSFYGTLVCSGVFSLLFFQIFVNVGMNMGIMPITGITLPFLSYGGSSMLSTMISLGIVESVSRFKKPEEAIEIR